eukprot:CAMPEP_0197534148 /NCGR_PEP_ID=MMETSP1318-20131121/46090_1 /TAXON_ID=552666 /ORGANISM="Partenskyella glossopodia, Strain RCC365" /LENGTH=126 /DNA_ID=CAMNT_0043091303 /DNA_START=149 /DNA_END=529 /DNA_ORIENTATION=-
MVFVVGDLLLSPPLNPRSHESDPDDELPRPDPVLLLRPVPPTISSMMFLVTPELTLARLVAPELSPNPRVLLFPPEESEAEDCPLPRLIDDLASSFWSLLAEVCRADIELSSESSLCEIPKASEDR